MEDIKLKKFNEMNEEVEITQVQKDVKAEVKEMKPKTKNAYQQFFSDKLKKMGKTFGELGDQRGQFFKEISKEWATHKKTLAKTEKTDDKTMETIKLKKFEQLNEAYKHVVAYRIEITTKKEMDADLTEEITSIITEIMESGNQRDFEVKVRLTE